MMLIYPLMNLLGCYSSTRDIEKMAIIEAHELTRKFKDLVAVDSLELNVDEGEVLGFLGPNGAGKTTTIRMLAGIIAPTSGHAVVAGQRSDGDIEALHQNIGLLTEAPGFYDHLTAQRNLEFFAGFYSGIDVPARIEKYLKLMGLWERRGRPGRHFLQGYEATPGARPGSFA